MVISIQLSNLAPLENLRTWFSMNGEKDITSKVDILAKFDGVLKDCRTLKKVKNLHERVTRRRHNSGGITDSHSGSDEESIVSYAKQSYLAVKTCASCGTHRTPLWRDAEDGTPLCNACGIRYKKYRVRCGHCWSIPKKDVKTYPNCPMCGSLLRLSFSRRTW